MKGKNDGKGLLPHAVEAALLPGIRRLLALFTLHPFTTTGQLAVFLAAAFLQHLYLNPTFLS